MTLITNKRTLMVLVLVILGGLLLLLGLEEGQEQDLNSPNGAKTMSAGTTEGSPLGSNKAVAIATDPRVSTVRPGQGGTASLAGQGITSVQSNKGSVGAGSDLTVPAARTETSGLAPGAVGEGAGFFVEYRMERDRVRGRQTSLLREIIDNPNSAADTRQEAQRQLMDISKRIEQELELENLLAVKGYQEAVLFIQASGVIVVIRGDALKQEDQLRIVDLVARVTEHPQEKVTIIPRA